MEGEGGATLYVLACNDLERLSPALRSRCTLLTLDPLTTEDMRNLIGRALERTSFSLDEGEVASIVERSNGVPREAIKLLL